MNELGLTANLDEFYRRVHLSVGFNQSGYSRCMLYRHGDRSPTHVLLNLPHPLKPWPQGLGQLTQEGMRQEAKLGEFFKNRYVHQLHLINATYVRREVKIRSTDYDRTLMSAEAQLSALYRPAGRQIWNKNLLWQPIPIHTVPRANDTLLKSQSLACPRYDQSVQNNLKSNKFKDFIKKDGGFVKKIYELAGYNGSHKNIYYAAHEINGALFCMQKHNLTLPHWANSTVLVRLRKIALFVKLLKYSSPIQQKVTAGELLYRMIHDMKSVKSGTKMNPTKLMMYSAHDSNVMAILLALGFHLTKNPPYTAAVMLELYKDKNGTYLVQVLYRNSSVTVTLQLPGCKRLCPLNDFEKLTSNVTFPPLNRKEICTIKTSHTLSPVNIAIIAAVGGIIILFGILLILRYYFRHVHSKQSYDRIVEFN
ncbi:Testicular acid phosphatase-like protein [Trichoplax sp. H2]|nr:Testicular acid phosphatase-like protein [Trichoplax sp. H2]|eukprot:RDD45823.1 Testicular acid phosphatase-like protein [Trichoplax sp. H2]